MKTLYDKFQNLKIKNKILLCFLLVIVVSIATIGFLYTATITGGITNIANESTQMIINQVNTVVENRIKYIEKQIDLLASDKEILQFCDVERRPKTQTERSFARISICDRLIKLKDAYSEIIGMALISEDDNFISNEMFMHRNMHTQAEVWRKQCTDRPQKLHLFVNPVSRSLTYYSPVSFDNILCLAKAITDEKNAVIGLVVIDITLDTIRADLEGIIPGKDGFVMILDADENIIFSPVNPIAPRVSRVWFDRNDGVFEQRILNEDFQFIYETSQTYNWKFAGVYSLAATLHQVTEARFILWMTLIGVCMLAVIMSIFFSATIVKPLLKLQKLMLSVHDGDLSVRFHSRYQDEIGSLGRAFNAMTINTQRLIELVWSVQKKKRFAELSALQAQINPHFLYNTFDTIHWLAKKNKADEIIYVVQSLTSLFRISLSKGSELIQLKEEVKHVESYLKIQKVRYEDILSYSIHIAGQVEDLYIQKLILQPIVENALYHGIKAKESGGRIEISIQRLSDALLLSVSDDGSGMTAARVHALNRTFGSDQNYTGGFGLFNVNQRIKLAFGKDFGLHVVSSINQGTTITIKYPLVNSLDNWEQAMFPVDHDVRREND